MSLWDENSLFGQYSDVSRVEESNQETAVQSSHDTRRAKLPDLNEEPTVQFFYWPLDLNEKPYVDPSYLYHSNQDIGFGGQHSYPSKSNQEFNFGGQNSYPSETNYEFLYSDLQQPNPEFTCNGETSEPQQSCHESVNEPDYPKINWKTNEIFVSLEEFMAWVKGRALDNGYIIVTGRSKKKKGTEELNKLWLVCDRGGEHKSTAILRRTRSKKIGCPFKLIGIYDEDLFGWKLQVRNDNHNHEPAQNLEGHPFVRRLSEQEHKMVEHLTEQNIEPRNILSSIKKQNPNNISIRKDIYNARQKIKNKNKVGSTSMQVLENLLQGEKLTVPLVQKDIRGRPTLKAQPQREEDARFRTVVNSQQSTFDPQRHSSFTPANSNHQNAVMHFSLSTTSQNESKIVSVVKPGGMNNLKQFSSHIPKLFHGYINNIQDVQPDGNCGFRSVAVGLGFHENQWAFIRQQLLQELDTHSTAYRYVFDSVDPGSYDTIRHSINWHGITPAPSEHWMLMPYTGLVVAQRFGVIVHLFSERACQTFFPLWFGPTGLLQHNVVCLVHLPMHFINVKLEGDYPIPTISAIWKRYRNDAAGEWERLYEDRIEQYQMVIERDKELHHHIEIM